MSSKQKSPLLALVSGVGLIGSLLIINIGQIASLIIRPFSSRKFRRINRFFAHSWWGWLASSVTRVQKTRIEWDIEAGDEPYYRTDNAVIVCNHQAMADIPLLLCFAQRYERQGDVKWFVKDILKYLPGIGWGMMFLDCVFLKRTWDKDKDSIQSTFQGIVSNNVPTWMASFPEGTRITPLKLAKSQTYARMAGSQSPGIWVPEHVLIPRVKGFAATIAGLRNHVHAVYDMTLSYPEYQIAHAPSLWNFMGGECKHVKVKVRRIPIGYFDDHAPAAWLMTCFKQKDEALK
jgi:1-acyl-sn-glycerol-3-phosphate acyltransferase